MSDNKSLPSVQQKTIADSVLAKVSEFQATGTIVIPKDYSPENALKSAWLILQSVKDRNGNAALEVCTKDSIANSLFEMVTQGLNPMKKHGDFLVYGNQLVWQREYAGNIALAKRYGNLKEIHANVIYDDDVFEYAIDSLTGRKTVTKHEQSIDNIDNTKIRGAYAVCIFTDGTSDMIPMTMAQIKSSWNQGAAKGNSGAHQNFADEMAKKTVINRACKLIFRESDDSAIIPEKETDVVVEASKAAVEENANRETITVDDAEVVESIPTIPPADKPEPKKEVKKPEFAGPGF